MDDYVSRAEFNETVKRLDSEDHRQNERLQILDEKMENNTQLTISVKELATNMSSMQKEQVKQGERLEKLENRDGEIWRKIVSYTATAIVGIVVGFILKQVGIF